MGDAARAPAVRLTADLRAAGVGALLGFGGRSLKAQLKAADKAGLAYALILGDQELAQGVVVARNMGTGQQEAIALAGVVEWLREKATSNE